MVDWGSVPAWLGAVGTIGAVVVALTLAVRDSRRYAVKADIRAAERRDLEAAQARLVLFELSAFGGVKVTIVNRSNAPIHRVSLDNVVKSDSPGTTWRVNPRVTGARAAANTIDAQSDLMIPVDLIDATGRVLDNRIGEYTITFSFLDAAGLRWTKTGMNAPTRVLDSE
ncbi:hypothetical protein HQO90_11200 [Rhodococcus fascians]|nr:hypothetical protein [Rhodococcus fascians]MBY4058968.1 hypothetical protein [Rhodococcus fascians]MBY4067820.1 hypothetical protein [Rhodococcus fascians]